MSRARSSTAARTRRPTFLHLRTTRVMGHAGTDFEIEWRSVEELVAVEASDPLLRRRRDRAGVRRCTRRSRCWSCTKPRASAASPPPRRPTAVPSSTRWPRSSRRWRRTRRRPWPRKPRARPTPRQRLAVFGGAEKLPETLPPRHLAHPDQCHAARPADQVSRGAAVRRGRGAEGWRVHGDQGPVQGVQAAAACSTPCSMKP